MLDVAIIMPISHHLLAVYELTITNLAKLVHLDSQSQYAGYLICLLPLYVFGFLENITEFAQNPIIC